MKWLVVRALSHGLCYLIIAIGPAALADTLEGQFTFAKRAPKVALIYFPEDTGLSTDMETIVDQKDQQFTKRLLVTTKGVQATFQNSDKVNHNIFTDDKKAGVKFDVGLMPPGGHVKQEREHSMILTPHREPLYNREKLVNPPIGKDSPWDKLRLSC